MPAPPWKALATSVPAHSGVSQCTSVVVPAASCTMSTWCEVVTGGSGMWLPDLADPAWMRDVLSRHAGQLGLIGEVASTQLVDVRLTHPHRPESSRCRGWATYVVALHGGSSVQLYLKGFPDRATSEAAWRQDRAARPAGRSEHLAEHHLVVWRFPEDPRLPALPDLLASPLAPRVVPAAVGAALGPRSGLCVTVVRYQPEASATLRVGARGRWTDRVRQASRCRLGRSCRRTAPRAVVHDGTGAAASCRRAARRRPGTPGVVDARSAGSDADGRGSPA